MLRMYVAPWFVVLVAGRDAQIVVPALAQEIQN